MTTLRVSMAALRRRWGWAAVTILMASCSIAFLLLSLSGLKARYDSIKDWTLPIVSSTARVPFHWTVPWSYVPQIAALPEIQTGLHWSEWPRNLQQDFQGYSKFTLPTEKFSFYLMANTDGYPLTMPPDFFAPDPGVYEEWLRDRQGMMVEARVMKAKGWKKGELVTLHPTFGPFTARVSGVFHGNNSPRVIPHFDEVRKLAGAEAEEVDHIATPCKFEDYEAASRKIDDLFRYSGTPTLTTGGGETARFLYRRTFATSILYLGLVIFFAGTMIVASLFAMMTRRQASHGGRAMILTQSLAIWIAGIVVAGTILFSKYRHTGINLQFGVEVRGWGLANTIVTPSATAIAAAIVLLVALTMGAITPASAETKTRE